ncbi:MAG TPA: hypothetical protein DFK12_07560 [Gallionellaceae bacterium]|nr:hypothetical protein [Gallionellaceae bacterium]
MGQSFAVNGKLDRVLLAMTSHELKHVMSGVIGMLEAVELEISRNSFQSLETSQVVSHMSCMHSTIINLLPIIDDLLDALSYFTPEIVDMLPGMQSCDGKRVFPELREGEISAILINSADFSH